MLTVEPLFRKLGTRSSAVVWACIFYVIHLLLQDKIAASETAAGFAFVFVTAAVLAGEIRPSFHILCYPLALYGLASSISSLLAPREIHAFGESMLWVKLATFPTALILLRVVPPFRKIVLGVQGVVVSGLAIWGIGEYFLLGQRDLEHRITAGATHVMTFSGIILPLSLLFLVLWVHDRKPWMLASASLGAFALLLTFTRSAWLAWLTAVFALIILARPRLMAYAVPILLVFVTFMPMAMFARLASSFDTKEESNLDRIRMLQAGVEIIRDYPLFGVGPANIRPMYPLYRATDAPRFRTPHLHNNVMQIWAERGVLALTGYVLLFALFLRECVRGWGGPGRKWAQAGVAIALAMTVAGMFEFNFGDSEVFYLTLDLMALVVANLEAVPEAMNPAAGLFRWATGS